MRLLVVEDQYASARLISRLLTRIGPVDVATSKDEALQMANEVDYDLFVIDMNLGGGGTGTDLLHTLRQDPRHARVPMIACSAYVHPESSPSILDEGFDGFIPKPFSITELLDEVTRQLNARA